jgi:hypothetical protein
MPVGFASLQERVTVRHDDGPTDHGSCSQHDVGGSLETRELIDGSFGAPGRDQSDGQRQRVGRLTIGVRGLGHRRHARLHRLHGTTPTFQKSRQHYCGSAGNDSQRPDLPESPRVPHYGGDGCHRAVASGASITYGRSQLLFCVVNARHSPSRSLKVGITTSGPLVPRGSAFRRLSPTLIDRIRSITARC